LTESRLRVLHRKIAEVMERREPNPSPQVLSELGRHYFLGKVPAKSYEFNRRAAANARAAGDTDVAILHHERASVDLGAMGDYLRAVGGESWLQRRLDEHEQQPNAGELLVEFCGRGELPVPRALKP
jgi:hypothetical protein